MFIVSAKLRVKFIVLVIFRVRLNFSVRVRNEATFTFMPMARFSVRFRVSI